MGGGILLQWREMFFGMAWNRGKSGPGGLVGLLGGRGVDGTGAGGAVAGVFAGGTGLVGLRGGWRRRGGGMLRRIGRFAGVFRVGGAAVNLKTAFSLPRVA